MPRLGAQAEAAGYRLSALDRTGSTNDDALEAARRGDPGLLWIVAVEQLSGRGRQGRTWVSPPGNLYASLLLVEPAAPAITPQLGFVAGLALHDAVTAVAHLLSRDRDLTLKWPNDLLLGGAKIAGLLLEGHRVGPGGRTLAVVIGCGVNVAHAPTDTPYPATALQSICPALDSATLFEALSDAFARRFAAWQAAHARVDADPFGETRRLWTERAAGLGALITVRHPSGERRGTFRGLDSLGRLQLQTPAGLELIDAGDISFPNIAAAAADPASQASSFTT